VTKEARDALQACAYGILAGVAIVSAMVGAHALDRPAAKADWNFGFCYDRGYVFPARAGSFSSPMCFAEDRSLGYILPGCTSPAGPLMLVPNPTRLE
jgi:hypothetical protein